MSELDKLHREIEGSIALHITPHPLTREQVEEWMFRHQNSSIARQRYRETSQTLDRMFAYDAELHELEEKLLAHDTAQRQALAQQAQEVERLKLKEAELGELKLRLNCPMLAPSCLVCGHVKPFVIKHLEASAVGVCEDCRSASQQLAASQARARELEGEIDRLEQNESHIKEENDSLFSSCSAFEDQLATLQATLAARERRIQELEALMRGELKVERMEFTQETGLNLHGSHPLMAAITAGIVGFFKDAGGPNYVEMSVIHKELGPFTVTVQKKFDAKTPHELRREAEEQRDTARQDAARLQSCLIAHMGLAARICYAEPELTEYRTITQEAQAALKGA